MIKNPFADIPPAELKATIDHNREHYLKKDSIASFFAMFPNFEKVFESMVARIGERKATATGHAAIHFCNHVAMTMTCAKVSGAPGKTALMVVTSSAHSLIELLVFQGGIDPVELFTLVNILNRDTDKVIGDLTKGE